MKAFVCLAFLALLSVTSAPSAALTPITTPSAGATTTATSTPSAAASTTATSTPSAAATPTATSTPSAAATPTATSTPSAAATTTATSTPSAAATPTATSTPSAAATPTATSTPTTASTTAAPTTTTSTPTTASTTAAPTTTTSTPTTASTTAAPTTTTSTPTTASTTAAPTTTTPTPTTVSTTAAPTTTTSTPTTASTTAAPTTTTSTPTTVSSTAAPTTTTSTKGTPSSGPSSSATSATTSNPNPDATGLCREKSCFGGSLCVNLNMSHFCLCIDGYYYNSSQCNKGKVLPGTINVKMSEISGLENETSEAYENLHKKITNFFAGVFLNDDYGQTVIYKVRLPTLARSEMRAGDKLVNVEVVNIFAENSKENETTVSDAINKRISNNSADFESYAKQDRCEFYGCVKNNDDCSNGFLCKCKEGLERPNPQTAVCIALGPKCADTCKAEHNTQCVVKSDGTSDCVCLPGYQRDDNKKCQACAFGYSGVDCKDDFQLILTVVGTIAGILVLGMVIALICMRSKTSKNIEEQNLIENDFQSLRLQHTTGFSNPGMEGSIFPKVRMSFPNSQPLNPYAQRSMPRPDY